MNRFGLLILVLGLTLNGCNQKSRSMSDAESQIEASVEIKKTKLVDEPTIKNEITNLIRKALEWSDSKNMIDLLPAIPDKKDSIYIGFDKDKLEQNIDKLKNTNMFSQEFVENYKQIILKLDKKLKNNEFKYGPWFVGDMPPFNFGSESNPWCHCQDNMDWDLVEIEQINENEYYWKWGGLNQDTDKSWKDFRYRFKVIKEGNKWKISYLEGFDIDKIDI